MNKLVLLLHKTFFILVVSVALSSFANAQQDQVQIYSPRTQNLNVIDSIALSLYCTVSKIFDNDTREKCFTTNNSTNFNNTNTLDQNNITKIQGDIISINQNLQSQAAQIENIKNSNSGVDIQAINSAVQEAIKKNKITSSVAGNTIIKYVADPNASKIGYYNTIIPKNSFAVGTRNTITRSGTNSVVIGSNIVNTIPNSVSIGVSNNSKLFVGADGFVGIANSSTTGSRTSKIDGEQLSVSGKVRATAIDLEGSGISNIFPVDEASILPGHIVSFSSILHNLKGYDVNGIIKANNTKNILGVISEKSAVNLDADIMGLPVIFSGRVPVKISDENGKIVKGDRITLSKNIAGTGAKLILSGQSIGVALSDQNEKDTVLVLVKSEYISNPEFYK